MSGEPRHELIHRAVLALANDAGALDDLRADGMMSREMATWALRTSTARFDAGALTDQSAKTDLAGQGVAIVLAHSVAIGPLRAIALPLLRGASHVLVRPARGQARFAKRVAAHMAGLPVECVAQDDPSGFLARAYATSVTRVIAYGSDETLATIARDLPVGVTLEARGHGFGIAVIGDDAARRESVALDVARDVAHYDQFGCLSPQCVFVLGESSVSFAARLANALARVQKELPRGALDDEIAVRVTQWQGALAAIAEEFHRGDAYGVAALGSALFKESPGARNITVVPARDADHVIALLGPLARHLTCVGVSGDSVHGALNTNTRARIVSVGTMQDPAFDGYEDPRAPLVVTGI